MIYNGSKICPCYAYSPLQWFTLLEMITSFTILKSKIQLFWYNRLSSIWTLTTQCFRKRGSKMAFPYVDIYYSTANTKDLQWSWSNKLHRHNNPASSFEFDLQLPI